LRRAKSKLDQLTRLYIPPFQPRVEKVDVDFIARRLEKLPNWQWWRWLPLDGAYYTTTLSEFKRIIEWDRTNRKPYTLDRFDCDKYATYFRASVAWFFGINAVGIVLDYSSQHAYNIIMPHDVDKPLLYEPQTDEIFTAEQRDRRFYRLEQYLVLL